MMLEFWKPKSPNLSRVQYKNADKRTLDKNWLLSILILSIIAI